MDPGFINPPPFIGIDLPLPSFKYALACYYITMFAESSTNLARFDGLRYGVKKDGKDYLEQWKNIIKFEKIKF